MAQTFTRTPVTPELIQEITRKIVEAFHPRRIILFGSHARGDARPDSDIDLLVEMESEKSFYPRVAAVHSLFFPRDWSMDVFAFTPQEMQEQRTRIASIVPIAEKEGVLLYDAAARS